MMPSLQYPATIQHSPYTLTKTRDGNYQITRGRDVLGNLTQQEEWRTDKNAGKWKIWPRNGHPSGYFDTLSEAIEEIRDFDPHA